MVDGKMSVINNPYAKRKVSLAAPHAVVDTTTTQGGRVEERPEHAFKEQAETASLQQNTAVLLVNKNRTMGIQSQFRGSAVKACKKAATKRIKKRFRQKAIPGGFIFVEREHCAICRIEYQNSQGGIVRSIPHKAHHVRCHRNKKTRGISARSVEVEKAVQMNLKINNASLHSKLGRQLNATTPSVNPFFNLFYCQPNLESLSEQMSTSQINKKVVNQNGKNILSRLISGNPFSFYYQQWVTTPQQSYKEIVSNDKNTLSRLIDIKNERNDKSLANIIREGVDTHLSAYRNDSKEYNWLQSCKYPKALVCAIGLIVSTFTHRKPPNTCDPLPSTKLFVEAINNYHKFFPHGTCTYTFPPDDVEARSPTSPDYHSIIGESFIYLDWKLIVPMIELCCPNCVDHGISKKECYLQHNRTNWSKNYTLFPIWTNRGRPILAIIMKYKCLRCGIFIEANDGRLLAKLPAATRQIYPADPKYCEGAFHLDLNYSDDLEDNMKTYANGKVVGKRLHKKLGKQFTRKVESYLSLYPNGNYITFEDFKAGISPPSADSIRSFYKRGFYSNNSPYGYSDHNRIIREIQNVNVEEGDTIACDWTFQAVKNYNIKEATAIFDVNVGRTGEILTVGLVESTKVSQISHMLIEMIEKRKQFTPSVLYHDTCPNNNEFWKTLFGSQFEIRLGLFHLLHRIVDTLDNKCGLFWKALVALKKTVYEYNKDDYDGLLKALMNGSFDQQNKMYSSEEIIDLQHSKRWKQRCDPFLRKKILAGILIGQGIVEWVVEYREQTDSEGRQLFSQKTEKVARDQIEKVKYVEDPVGVTMYRKIPAGKKSEHQLPKWQSNRPESSLEKFHEHLAHMANTGSSRELADALILAGTGDHNVKARWKEYVNKLKLKGIEMSGTVEYENDPPFWDHSHLHLLNLWAIRLGLDSPFEFVVPPGEDNGEVFVSPYYEQQDERNKTVGNDGKFCNCRHCRCFLEKQVAGAATTTRTTPTRTTPTRTTPTRTIPTSTITTALTPANTPTRAATLSMPIRAVLPRAVAVAPVQMINPPQEVYSDWMANNIYKPCFYQFPYYCPPVKEYYEAKQAGKGRIGRPPRCDKGCPKNSRWI